MSMIAGKRKHLIIFSISITVLFLCITGCSTKPLQAEQAVGSKIEVSATGNMTIVRYFEDPDTVPDTITDTTNEDVPSIETNPSIDDEKQILAIFNGKEYVSETPACASDIYIYSDNYSFYIHTECGSIIATIDNDTMSSMLSDDELKDLLTICDAS